ncbi:MAG: hypothetical protein AB7I25_01390 [Vicinamibacterales bacterium]
MTIDRIDPPREFTVGTTEPFVMRDCARIALDAAEQVTFTTPSGAEYDVARTPWGFYATPSLNGRLPRFGLRPALVRNAQGRYFVFLVEPGKLDELAGYLTREKQTLVMWLDSDAQLAAIEQSAARGEA